MTAYGALRDHVKRAHVSRITRAEWPHRVCAGFDCVDDAGRLQQDCWDAECYETATLTLLLLLHHAFKDLVDPPSPFLGTVNAGFA
jgi:hypothetical protein